MQHGFLAAWNNCDLPSTRFKQSCMRFERQQSEMREPIYIIDPMTKQPKRVEPVSFQEIGIKERSDLEEWVINHPDILGEKLLVITSEFSGFDKSSKRLDILALDEDGVLNQLKVTRSFI